MPDVDLRDLERAAHNDPEIEQRLRVERARHGLCPESGEATATCTCPTHLGFSFEKVPDEVIAAPPYTGDVLTGTLNYGPPIRPNSMVIHGLGVDIGTRIEMATDDGQGGLLGRLLIGTINYATGAWALTRRDDHYRERVEPLRCLVASYEYDILAVVRDGRDLKLRASGDTHEEGKRGG